MLTDILTRFLGAVSLNESGPALAVHRAVSRFGAAALPHSTIASRLTVKILLPATIARNAVGLALFVIRCSAS